MKISKKIVSYTLRITDEPILINEVEHPQTGRISFRDATKNLLDKRKLGVVNVAELYEAIHQNKSIDIQGCVVQNFSLTDYRSKFGLDTDETVVLNNFNALGALFESDKVVDFSFAKFTGDTACFEDAHFGQGSLSFKKALFETDLVNFKNSSYSVGNNSFQFADFGSGDVIFDNSSFINGDISFINAHFNDGKASFKNVDFGDGSVLFKFADFNKGDVIFDKAIFNGPLVEFSKVNFGVGKVDFRRCDFGNSEVNFEEIQMTDNKMLFRRAKFGKRPVIFAKAEMPDTEMIFDEVDFGEGRISFFDVDAKVISIKSSILSSYVDLRVKSCKVVDLSNTIFRDIIDLKKGITAVDIEVLYIYGVRNLGKLFISWDANNIAKIIGGQKKTSLNQKADQFRLLKEDFHTLGQYEDEDKAYIEFKRNELLAGMHERSKKGIGGKVTGGLNFGFQKLVFDWMGLYATSPGRVLISIFTVYGIFSMMYVVFELTNHGQISCIATDMSAWEKILDSFYFSAVTFLTIGYGECTPTGFFKIIAPLEGWAGVFMMSYFTVAFVRKILR